MLQDLTESHLLFVFRIILIMISYLLITYLIFNVLVFIKSLPGYLFYCSHYQATKLQNMLKVLNIIINKICMIFILLPSIRMKRRMQCYITLMLQYSDVF